VSVDYTAGGNAMPAAGDRHRSGEQWRSARQEGVLRGVPAEWGDQRAVPGTDLSPCEGWRAARAARCRKHRRIRLAGRARLTGRGRDTPRFTGCAQVRVLVHHRAGLCDQQREREEHAEPRGIPTAGQESGLCHTWSIACTTGLSGPETISPRISHIFTVPPRSPHCPVAPGAAARNRNNRSCRLRQRRAD
jgi:hypothetical protein